MDERAVESAMLIDDAVARGPGCQFMVNGNKRIFLHGNLGCLDECRFTLGDIHRGATIFDQLVHFRIAIAIAVARALATLLLLGVNEDPQRVGRFTRAICVA
jgi:hypothetical protein